MTTADVCLVIMGISILGLSFLDGPGVLTIMGICLIIFGVLQ